MRPLGERLAPVLTVRQWAAAGNLWAILDATDAPSVLQTVAELGPARAISLYRGRAEEDLEAIAPYVVHVDPGTFAWITETLWAEPWGIFAVATTTLEELRLHFRRFLMVESPQGEDWYFRFYDPRILPRFLEVSTPEERSTFYGPVRAFGVTDQASYGVRVLTPEQVGSSPSRTQPIVVRRAG